MDYIIPVPFDFFRRLWYIEYAAAAGARIWNVPARGGSQKAFFGASSKKTGRKRK
ncbi:MAG: hypothetical protein J6U75_03325 [Clostridia bacterium]|nr:hypothetical protein [Clostridia bacterium]